MNNLDEQKSADEARNAAQEAEKRESRKEWKDTFRFVIIAIILVIPIRLFIAQPFLVEGISMDPTFHNGEYLIVDEISYRFESPSRDDVIVFKYPCPNPASEAGLTQCDPASTKYFIKRIIGLPGEKVSVTDGVVTVSKPNGNGAFALGDSFLVNHDQSNMAQITLGSDEYFVMGDNRPQSFDSRSWGPVKRSAIVGRTILRVLPTGRAGFFPGFAKDIETATGTSTAGTR